MSNVISGEDPSTGETGRISYKQLPNEVNGLVTVPLDENGNVVGSGSNVKFLNAITSNGVGTTINVAGYKKLGIEIIRTAVSTNTVSFLGAVLNNFYPILGVNVNSSSTVSEAVNSTSAVSELWEIDVTGLKNVQIPVTNLTGTGATITINGFLE